MEKNKHSLRGGSYGSTHSKKEIPGCRDHYRTSGRFDHGGRYDGGLRFIFREKSPLSGAGHRLHALWRTSSFRVSSGSAPRRIDSSSGGAVCLMGNSFRRARPSVFRSNAGAVADAWSGRRSHRHDRPLFLDSIFNADSAGRGHLES